ncbi:DNA-binding response regulator [Arachnia propionica]|uniref:DNA-binding response regulator n=1 Tax=Arachnia propionica TaxID=1750 RepID=A0A3P1T2K8_9ACTN|nr:response regulator transcription factor [Arachnia propionica]RRD03599.1 DNA-binding response regulator [Arachnia propionica]
MSNTEIRVLVAEDHDQVRARIQRIVDAMPGITVVGNAANGLTAVSAAKRLEPDVILMDISMPILNGIDASRQIVDLGLPSRIIALTSLEDDATFHEALRAGVAGFLLKTSSRGEIMHAIQQVHAGESMLSPSLITRVLAHYEPPHRPSKVITDLPDKDRELLRLIARGLSNTELAEHLGLSPATVKSYVSRLLGKLGARDRAQLVILAYENGLRE